MKEHSGPQVAHLVIDDGATECAVRLALEQAGCSVTDSEGWAVADRLPADMLVVPALAWPSRSALSALERGVVKVVLTLDSVDSMAAALNAASSGCAVISEAGLSAARELNDVSLRRLDVLAALAAGASNAQIADELHLSIPTVKREVTSLQRRFGVRDRAGLAARAHTLGFGKAL